MDIAAASAWSDEEIVKKSLENVDFFGILVDRYAPKLEAFTMRISDIPREEAEEIVQECFIKAWKNLNDFDTSIKFSTWIYQIVRNHTISSFRKRLVRGEQHKVSFDETLYDIPTNELDFSEILDRRTRAEKVHDSLQKMSKEHREILVLRYFEDKSYDEISDILKKPPGTVATLINRAKKAFQDIFLRHHSLSIPSV